MPAVTPGGDQVTPTTPTTLPNPYAGAVPIQGYTSAGTSNGQPWRVAGAIDNFVRDAVATWPGKLTCVGTLGDAAHQAQGGLSGHNPTVIQNGTGIVRSVDLTGPQALLDIMYARFNALYNKRDPRCVPYGYVHMNGNITVWDKDPTTTDHPDAGDEGHLHVSVTDSAYPATANSYAPGCDLRTGWQFDPNISVNQYDDPVNAQGVPTGPAPDGITKKQAATIAKDKKINGGWESIRTGKDQGDYASQVYGPIGKLIADTSFGALMFRGTGMSDNLSAALKSMNFSASYDQITQLTMEFEDPGLKLLAAGYFQAEGEVRYLGQMLEITASNSGPGDAGMGGATVSCRSKAVGELKRRQGTLSIGNISPSEFVRIECHAAKVSYVVQSTPKRAAIARDIPSPVANDSNGPDQQPSTWTTFTRLAEEEGFALFEFSGIVFFAQPSWLISRDECLDHTVWWNTPSKGEFYSARNLPGMSVSNDTAWTPVTTITVEVPLQRMYNIAVGDALKVKGVPYFDKIHGLTSTGPGAPLQSNPTAKRGSKSDDARYLITSVAFDLGGEEVASITAQTPVNPKPTKTLAANAAATATGTGKLGAANYAGQSINANQAANISAIYSQGVTDAVGQKGIMAALETGAVESHFLILANSNVPESLAIAHEGSGSDHDSVGIFQQRPSWGSTADRMDAAKSAHFFYSRFKNLDPITAMGTIGQCAQAVQVSAVPDAYDKQYALAAALYKGLTATVTGTADNSQSGTMALGANDKSASTFVKYALHQTRYPYVDYTPPRLDVQLSAFDCSLLIQWCAYQVGIKYPRGTGTRGRNDGGQIAWCESHHSIISLAQAIKTRGAVLFADPAHNSGNGHTAISLGDGRCVEAADSAQGILVDSAVGRPDFAYGAFIPGMKY